MGQRDKNRQMDTIFKRHVVDCVPRRPCNYIYFLTESQSHQCDVADS